jgi:site-specific recombinase XerD
MKKKSSQAVWEYLPPLMHKIEKLKSTPVAAFILSQKNSVNFMSSILKYRPPRLVKAKQGWYITYTYQIPESVRPMYGGKTWYRFRITEDMNRRKGEERENFATWMLEQIIQSLKEGYNPFSIEQEEAAKVAASGEVPEFITAKKLFDLFLTAWSKRGLDPVSITKYKKYVNRLAGWLDEKKMLYNNIKNITPAHIELYLTESRTLLQYSNREYNNTYDFTCTIFNYAKDKDIITRSPCDGITKLKVVSTKHRFYDNDNMAAIKKALLAKDAYTFLAFQVVYYLCIRSDKELMNFRVKDINFDQNKILLDAQGTKGKAARYIPMDDNIKALLLNHGVKNYPAEYYVFGIEGIPAKQKFGQGFFARRFRKVRDAAGLPKDFTMYAAKHTRIIHLKQDGLSDADIMSVSGHKDFGAYAKYLRDLGMDANPEKINKVSRKI